MRCLSIFAIATLVVGIGVARANNDTFYSNGVLDLRSEPVIFKMPEANNRYYVFQLVSQTTDNFDYIGTRLRGSKAGVFAVTGPDFTGKLPEGVLKSRPLQPSSVWWAGSVLMGRIRRIWKLP